MTSQSPSSTTSSIGRSFREDFHALRDNVHAAVIAEPNSHQLVLIAGQGHSITAAQPTGEVRLALRLLFTEWLPRHSEESRFWGSLIEARSSEWCFSNVFRISCRRAPTMEDVNKLVEALDNRGCIVTRGC